MPRVAATSISTPTWTWPADAPIIDAIAPAGDFNVVTAAPGSVGLGSVPTSLRPYRCCRTARSSAPIWRAGAPGYTDHLEAAKHVGDELIATWPLAPGAEGRDLRARMLRRARSVVAHGADYERQLGAAAQVRASLHCGSVVVGEMGSVKKEIALLGDTLNTAARLVDACRDSGEAVIASADLLDRLVLSPGIAARSMGLIRLRGKEQAIGLYALVQPTPDARLAAR